MGTKIFHTEPDDPEDLEEKNKRPPPPPEHASAEKSEAENHPEL